MPVGYALRTEGASDGENDDSGGGYYGSPTTKHNPYKFENPDAVGTKVLERRKRRRQRAEEELKWNDGMANWKRQRDAWTQARPDRAKQPRKPPDPNTVVEAKLRHLSDSTDGSISQSSHDSLGQPAPTSSIESIEPDTILDSHLDDTSTLDETQGPWLPIYPPLLPDTNPVRANIRPAAYDHIYSKVVIQALTPSLPIPLTHMTYALVEGWKADGAWPSQPTDPTHHPTPSTNIGSTAQRKARSVLDAIRRRPRNNTSTAITTTEKSLPQRKPPPPHIAPQQSPSITIPTTNPSSPPIPTSPSVRRSIDTVKRALFGHQRDPDSAHSHSHGWSSGGSRRASRNGGDFGIDFEDSSQQQLEQEPEREGGLNVELNKGLVAGNENGTDLAKGT